MTDGEGREHFHYLERGEVRVPISALYRAPSPSEEIGDEEEKSSTWIPVHESSQTQGTGARDPTPDLASDEEEQPPYPMLASVVFFCIKQTTRPRSWCLRMVCNPWFEHVSMLVILLNCVTLGMFQPCEDLKCQSEWCIILQAFDDCIFAFFAVEMVIKMIALGIFGPKCYLGDTWNRLDFFIVMAGMLEYSLDGHNASLSAIRTVRVLRPLRAINRVPSMRILVTLLLDTLPMLGNVLLLCFFVFFIFGIVGVQLWAGLLRNRCFMPDDVKTLYNLSFMSPYYMNEDGEDNPFICSANKENGMLRCSEVPRLKEGVECTLNASSLGHAYSGLDGTGNRSCVNWNQYYNVCKAGELNPHKGAVNFDNIGYAWIAIFQVITLEGWVDIMYYVMDAHSFYNFIYFILLIIVGSFFMINLCLVVIATQFSETKQRENQLMQEQRACYLSNDSTLASYSEPGSCYEEMLRYISHLYRKVKRRASRIYNNWQSKRRKKVNPNSVLSGGGGTGGGVNGHSRHRGGGNWVRSIHNLIQQHQRQHCHLSNGSPSPVVSTGCGEALEMRSIATGPHLTVSSQPTGMHNLSSRTQSVHSIYQGDFHEGRTSATVGVPALGRLNGGMNYPTILPSLICSYTGSSSAGKGSGESDANTGCEAIDPFEKLHQLMGEHSHSRVLLQIAGVVPTQLLLELLSCPYCSRALETMDLELSDSDYSRSEGDVVYEFSHGAEFKPSRVFHHKILEKRNRLAQFWEDFRDRLTRIVDSKYFNQGIMIAILINTLSMGIEHHEQPMQLTNVLEISNIVFTSMFVLEMLFKLLAFGTFGYIKNPYNIFDGIIVVISVWEIVGQADGGLSVLRTFRLLRVLKLVRFLPALRRQLVVLMKTMDNVATFCMLLMLFIFTFSILGMHLFGCKFSQKMENGDTIPDRKNFDSLLWAIVTVFQILTQEDWNVVLYNGMASTSPWAALYFVALMTFGNYVLFNLLVAILVEGFQAEGDANRSDADEEKRSVNFEQEEKMGELRASELKMYSLMMSANGHVDPRGTLPPPIIMHTAATPMPTPKSSLGPESVFSLTESRRGSGISIDPNAFDQKSLTSPRRSPCHTRGSGSNWGSRRSSWNSLGRAPSLKRKDTSGEKESLLSGEGRGSFEDEDLEGEKLANISGGSLQYPSSLDIPELPQTPSFSSLGEYHDCNGRSLHVPIDLYSSLSKEDSITEEDMDDSFCLRLKRTLEAYKPKWCKDHDDWSLYLFSPQNKFRMMCQRLISHKMFDHVVLVFIFLNCITIAMERPIEPKRFLGSFLDISNYVFTVIFVSEMTVKVVALGFCCGKHSYLQSTWNVLDGVLVFVSLIDILVSLASSTNRIFGILRVLRLLRTLRPLRVISRAPGLKLVVETLITSLRPIGNIVLICCAFFIVFGILGVQLFKGKFYHCEGGDTKNITNKSECRDAKYKWIRRKYNFDNLGQALMSLFVLSCKDGWVNIMYDGLDAVGVDQQPVRNHNPWMLLYFISFLLIVSFFVLNMFVGVVVENFHKCRQDQEEEEARLREEKRQKLLEKKRRKAQQRPYYADYSPARLYIHTLCTNHYLDLFITCIIGINVVTMSIEHFNQPRYLEEALKYCNYVFTIIFIIEALLKLVAFGVRRFFKDRWNQLDLAIVLLSIMGITLEEIKMNAALPINPTIIRIMRVLRIARVLKLLKMATGMRALLDTVMQALPQVGNLGLLFMLLFFIYAALGVELFGKLDCTDDVPCEGLSRHATFENFGMAFLTLFRVSTGDNWNGIMKDTLRECPEDDYCYLPLVSPIYFVTFVLMAQFVLVNVVVAVLMKHLEESNKEAKEDAEMDAEIELEMKMARRLSNVSAGSSSGPEGRATYVGPQQDSLKQEEGMQKTQENLLSPRKMSVSRMHSLPNDSYMFRPVRPASAPYPLKEVETSQGYLELGSITSVHSQPCESRSLLQVPGVPPHSQFSCLPKIPPPISSPTHSIGRTLCRQEAVKNDSIDVQSFDSKDNLERQTGSFKPHFPRIPGPSVPQESQLLPPRGHASSVRTFQQQHNIPSRPPSLASSSGSTSPSGSMFDSADATDEEVRHINSTARLWAGVQAEARSHSLSPYATSGTLLPMLVKNCSSAANLGELSVKDPKKCFGVDTEGFLAKPYGADEHRRHSIEICSSGDDGLFGQELSEKRHVPTRGQSLHIPRKKKMSPPCISIEPPFEKETSGSLASMKKLSESSMLLRRRTPSYELALQRDSLDVPENQLSTQPLIKVERHPSHCAEYLSLPHPAPTGSLAGVLCENTRPPPFDSRFEESTDFGSVNRTAQ
ncbi:voltage-dependent T-type calcium channel subunit alpha-1H isoform X2 [Pimephales promelas]|uniref:voltage-dependent T-type calcium channel subunit alpha-1H isoform X2 n=1 Tax=Pimephales promelas TaxID=90988 RepID=UPI0019558EFF|nr:voltage-dependent T-type calcium channel subunit alpha-1H isoform X2 [Pimephales promelas]KAG1968483.1 voltage-dependent T-type calcium channel subunit alpha-1H [Pimephales promelas]